MSCLVCTNRARFRCACQKTYYCSRLCQGLDFGRHAPLCIGVQIDARVFNQQEQAVIDEFIRVTQSHEDVIRYFSMPVHGLHMGKIAIDTDETLKQLIILQGNRAEDLVRFLTWSSVDQILKTLPTTSQQRTTLLAPYLWTTIDNTELSGNHKYLGIPPAFTELLLYPRSKRPLFDMRLFWQWYNADEQWREEPAPDWTVPPSQGLLLDNSIEGVVKDQTLSIPVLRLQEGMSRGAYYKKSTTQEFCGTFFYFEPDSPANLLSRTTLIAVNKVRALQQLHVSLKQVIKIFYRSRWLIDTGMPLEADTGRSVAVEFARSILGADVPILGDFDTLREAIYPVVLQRLYNKNFDIDRFHPLMYAFEDMFDQFLCKAADKAGIETVLLTRMTGKNRLVSEILDTRDRRTIFRNMWIRE